ncbi:MAG TPA: TonB-dependent receptor [Rudaea sp.]|nr:TonB-dependent receptor [Rudaea sp.]
MKYRKNILTASILASLFLAAAAQAQDAAKQVPDAGAAPVGQVLLAQNDTNTGDKTKNKNKDAEELGTIVVSGIRESLKASLDKKRDADAIIDAITAEDIGKFPATNVAEAMAQLPGVTLDRAFGATQKVSIDGLDPSLNLSYLDGHPIAQAVWRYGDNPDRGFNYSLLPPEILGGLEIYKSPEARLPEGSLGGTIIMHTRLPLDLPSNTVDGSVGWNYNDMESKGKPNVSGFYSWKNDDKTFGFDVSAQHYEQVTSRQGEEIFGYTPVANIAASNPAVAAQVAAGSIKSSDVMPNEINIAYFQQTEKRDSVTSNIQFKPNENFETTLGLMWMRDDLSNWNQSMYAFPVWLTSTVAGIDQLTSNGHGLITSGHSCDTSTQPDCAGRAGTVFDNQVRHSVVSTRGADWRASWRQDNWKLSGQIGVSTSRDPSTQAFIEPVYFGGYTWDISKGFKFDDTTAATNPANWAGAGWMGNYGEWPDRARDNYAQADFSMDLNGFLNQLLLGVRWADHHEGQNLLVWSGGVRVGDLTQVGAGGLTDLSAFDFWSGAANHVQPSSGGAVTNWVLGSPNVQNPQFLYAPYVYQGTYNIDQASDAAYAQLNFGDDKLRGNFGLRFVHSTLDSSGYVVSADQVNTLPPPAGSYQTVSSTHNNVLPALNIAYTVQDDFILRGALSETIAFAPYNQEAPYTFTNDSVLTGAGGNARLSPYKSNNFNFSAEWYFAPESILAASVFYKDVRNYIVNGVETERLFNSLFTSNPDQYAQLTAGNCDSKGFCDYSISRPVDGGKAKVKGFAVSYQQAFGETGFGVRANYTYSDGSTHSGGEMPYNSKNSYSLSPYYEKDQLSASLSFSRRSSYLAGGYVAGAPDTFVAPYKELDASVAWRFNSHLQLSLDALNLLDSTYYSYFGTPDMLSGKYKNGTQYMLTLHMKL